MEKISDEEFSIFQKDIDDFKLQKQRIQNVSHEKQTTDDVEKLKHFLNEMKETLQRMTETNKSPFR